ncbi:MAG: DUF4147 domain-containing protein [bacterium]
MRESTNGIDRKLGLADQIWRAGVDRVNGKSATQNALAKDHEGPWRHILALGKGASAMLLGALDFLTPDAQALLVTKYGHVDQPLLEDSRIEIIESGHPMPDSNSIRAGNAVREFIQQLPAEASLLVLVSGGASALVESLAVGIDLAKLQKLSARLLADGYSIDQINFIRIAVSTIKGGKLIREFKGRLVQVYGLSDIPGDDADLIGSGIAAIQPPEVESFDVPPEIQRLLDQTDQAAVPELNYAPEFEYRSSLVGSNTMARQAAAQQANSMGMQVLESTDTLRGDILELAPILAARIATGGNGVYIWGGEPTVKLPENPGKGGRNQSLAIALGLAAADQPGVYGLVAGTDGSDGPTDAAGGFFYTGMDLSGARGALSKADAGSWLASIDQQFVTGPTGTNVMDLAVVIKQA